MFSSYPKEAGKSRLAAQRYKLLLGQVRRWARRVLSPFGNPFHWVLAAKEYARFARSFATYRRLLGAEPLFLRNLHPCLFEAKGAVGLDPHYASQDTWAFQRIARNPPPFHVDVASRADFALFLCCLVPVFYLELRPPKQSVPPLTLVQADLLQLPLRSYSIPSLSCLHVAEHVGLGRYGDRLNPHGTEQAMSELKRVLAPAGHLYFSLPVGRPRVCFNAHRILSPQAVVALFTELKLVEFAAVTDEGCFRDDLKPEDMSEAKYACGLFHFTREPPT